MNIKKIIEATKTPALYEKGTASMWEDKYISRFLLEAHINPDLDLASRNSKAIDTTVNWILSTNNKENMNILDMGCGPGLYCELMAQQNHTITGIDFSERSINYATSQAEQKKLKIKYIKENYLNLNYENEFDLIIMIFCDFGALIPSEREIVAANIHKALKPGGTFIFDALNTNVTKNVCKNKEWEITPEGFWRNSPYIVLSEPFKYEDGRVLLDQHIVIDETGKHEIYRFWNHCFTALEMTGNLSEYGFINIKSFEDILNEKNGLWNNEVTFYKAEKKA